MLKGVSRASDVTDLLCAFVPRLEKSFCQGSTINVNEISNTASFVVISFESDIQQAEVYVLGAHGVYVWVCAERSNAVVTIYIVPIKLLIQDEV